MSARLNFTRREEVGTSSRLGARRRLREKRCRGVIRTSRSAPIGPHAHELRARRIAARRRPGRAAAGATAPTSRTRLAQRGARRDLRVIPTRHVGEGTAVLGQVEISPRGDVLVRVKRRRVRDSTSYLHRNHPVRSSPTRSRSGCQTGRSPSSWCPEAICWPWIEAFSTTRGGTRRRPCRNGDGFAPSRTVPPASTSASSDPRLLKSGTRVAGATSPRSALSLRAPDPMKRFASCFTSTELNAPTRLIEALGRAAGRAAGRPVRARRHRRPHPRDGALADAADVGEPRRDARPLRRHLRERRVPVPAPARRRRRRGRVRDRPRQRPVAAAARRLAAARGRRRVPATSRGCAASRGTWATRTTRTGARAASRPSATSPSCSTATRCTGPAMVCGWARGEVDVPARGRVAGGAVAAAARAARHAEPRRAARARVRAAARGPRARSTSPSASRCSA